MKISIIRGPFLNPFELQNYYPLAKKNKIFCVSSHFPINNKIKLPVKKLWSPTDLPIPYKYQILNRILPDAHYLFGLEKLIKGSDIAHVAETYFNYTYQAIKAKRAGQVKKIISTVWEVIPHNNESLPGRKNIKQIARKEIDHFIAVTKVAKDALIEEGVEENKISVIPVGIDLSRFRPSTKKTRTKVQNILYVGRLVPEKGVGELLEVFTLLKKKYPKLNLTMIGDGPLRNKCQKAGARVLKIPYSQIHHQYQKADIFCFPTKPTSTWQEQYGMVLVEALASGLPILTSHTNVTREVCSDSALYALPGDSLQLTNQLAHLIDNYQLRKRLSQTSRKLALARYNYRHIAQQILTVYHKSLGR